MSEVQQGPGWWVASDGKWYPPETHPDARVRADAAAAAQYGGTGQQHPASPDGTQPAPYSSQPQQPAYLPETRYIQPAEFSQFNPSTQQVHVAGGLPTFGQLPNIDMGQAEVTPPVPQVDPSELLPIPEEAVAVDTYRGPRSRNPALRRKILIIVGIIVLGVIVLGALGYEVYTTFFAHSSLGPVVTRSGAFNWYGPLLT